jgi:hypothetical protein
MKLLTTPPSGLLLASIERVLRAGIPQIPALTPATPWAHGEACPAGHPFFPAGARIYDYMVIDEKDCEVCCELLCDDQAVPLSGNDDRLWKVSVELNVMWDRDIWDSEEGEQLQAVLKMVLTNAITLPDGSVQTAQDRLSTPELHVAGTRDADNFLNQRFDKLSANVGHPFLSFSMDVICAGIYVPPA